MIRYSGEPLLMRLDSTRCIPRIRSETYPLSTASIPSGLMRNFWLTSISRRGSGNSESRTAQRRLDGVAR